MTKEYKQKETKEERKITRNWTLKTKKKNTNDGKKQKQWIKTDQEKENDRENGLRQRGKRKTRKVKGAHDRKLDK